MYPLVDPLTRLEDRARTMNLVRRNPQAVQRLYVTGIRLCNRDAESQSQAIALRLTFRAMVATQLEKQFWPETMKQFFADTTH